MVGVCFRLTKNRKPVKYVNSMISMQKEKGWVYHPNGWLVPKYKADDIKEVIFAFLNQDSSDLIYVIADVIGVESLFTGSWNDGKYIPKGVENYTVGVVEPSTVWWKLTNFRRADPSYIKSLVTITESIAPCNLSEAMKGNKRTGLFYYRTPDVDVSSVFKKALNDGLIF